VAQFTLFDKQILGRVLGKGQRSVVAVADGPLADTIKNEISRYMHIAGEV
jgi:ribosomal protein L7Ae-like RNA K-turn-binding protein